MDANKTSLPIKCFIIGVLSCVVAGLFLAFYLNNTWWLWLCLPVVLFLT